MTAGERGWTIAALVAASAVLLGSMVWVFGGVASTHAGFRTWGADVGGYQAQSFGRMHGGSMHGGWWLDDGASYVAAGEDLPGNVVDVYAMDMGAMGMRGTRMVLRTSQVNVDAGVVTLRLVNQGTVDHELVVLPLEESARIGQRAIGADGQVDESASLGEASATNAEGAGDGIAPGALGWVTLDLEPGAYELACNIDGHYVAGMYALLVVS